MEYYTLMTPIYCIDWIWSFLQIFSLISNLSVRMDLLDIMSVISSLHLDRTHSINIHLDFIVNKRNVLKDKVPIQRESIVWREDIVNPTFLSRCVGVVLQLGSTCIANVGSVNSFVAHTVRHRKQITRKSCVDRIWQNFVQCPDFFFLE